MCLFSDYFDLHVFGREGLVFGMTLNTTLLLWFSYMIISSAEMSC